MAEIQVFTIEGSSVADGNGETLTREDNESWTIKKVQVVEESATTLDASQATIKVAGDSVTDQSVTISALQGDYESLPMLGIQWPNGRQFEFAWTNDSGSSATVNVQLWVDPG